MQIQQLTDVLKQVSDRMSSGDLRNEAQIKQAVILPVLRALGWDDADPSQFRPELRIDKQGYVDYALFDQDSRPLVFLEAKYQGKLTPSGEEQLFRYANAQGIPLLILTDGNRWDLYQSMAAGRPSERLFASLNLQSEGRRDEIAEIMQKILERRRVVSMESDTSARQMLEERRARLRARHSIADVYRSLLNNPESGLSQLVKQRAEESANVSPSLKDISAFLKSQRVRPAGFSSTSPPPDQTDSPERKTRPRISGFEIEGHVVRAKSGKATLVALIQHLASEDPTFLERYGEATISRTRRVVAKNPRDLFADYEKFSYAITDLGNGWYVGCHMSSLDIRKRIATAGKVSGKEIRVLTPQRQ